MAYPYSLKPAFPIVEEISFHTDIIKQSSLFHAEIGTAASWQTTCPAPKHPVHELTRRKTLVSDDIDNVYEKRRVEYEIETIGYTFDIWNMTQTQRDNLVTFFNARKGMFDNFKISYSYLFGGVETLVRFDMDTLKLSLDSFKRYSTTITIMRSLNHRYIAKIATPRRKWTLKYDRETSLSALKTFYIDTGKGRSASFTFTPYSIATYLENTAYTVRFDSDDYIEKWKGDNDKNVEVELITVA
mgnify:CR=1 FL=1